MIKKGILLLVFILLLLTPITVQAKTTYRYTTQTVKLSKTLKVKRNTKVRLVKAWKVKAFIRYKGERYTVKKKYLAKCKAVKKYSATYLRRAGRINWQGYSFTWYSQRTMPGRGLRIPGRHVDKNGYVCDKDGYIVVGSCVANKNKRVIVPTPFGKFGKCYDCGYVGSKHFDCYVNW